MDKNIVQCAGTIKLQRNSIAHAVIADLDVKDVTTSECSL
jgi:hypothetical protein